MDSAASWGAAGGAHELGRHSGSASVPPSGAMYVLVSMVQLAYEPYVSATYMMGTGMPMAGAGPRRGAGAPAATPLTPLCIAHTDVPHLNNIRAQSTAAI